MALHKVLGTETEFGIAIRNQLDFNPALASGVVVNSYAGGRVRIQWSFEEESPGRDARGFGFDGVGAIDVDAGLVNAVLTNGARLYVDHAHPEYSTPECYDPKEAALYDKAGELVVARAGLAAQELLAEGERLALYKNNSDGKGNSYGAHENYLLARDLPFGDVVTFATTFLVTRQIFTGSGKVGTENGRPPVDFQLSQRADFFEEEVGLETTLKRPIINTRDEPHGDPGKYRRLHVIIGDANLSEVQNFIKLGSTALLLAALEDGAIPEPLVLQSPVDSTWQVSHDIGLKSPLGLADGGSATALELQFQYLEWLSKYAETELPDDVWTEVLEEWESVLTDLETDPTQAADRLDWAAKHRVLTGFVNRDDLRWSDPKLKALDLQYHDIDRAKGLYWKLADRGEMRRLFDDHEVSRAADEPPSRTRAYFRGRCVAKYPESLVAANWDSLVFDVGEESLKRLPMMEPLRGDEARVGELLAASEDAATLIQTIGGDDG